MRLSTEWYDKFIPYLCESLCLFLLISRGKFCPVKLIISVVLKTEALCNIQGRDQLDMHVQLCTIIFFKTIIT